MPPHTAREAIGSLAGEQRQGEPSAVLCGGVLHCLHDGVNESPASALIGGVNVRPCTEGLTATAGGAGPGFSTRTNGGDRVPKAKGNCGGEMRVGDAPGAAMSGAHKQGKRGGCGEAV